MSREKRRTEKVSERERKGKIKQGNESIRKKGTKRGIENFFFLICDGR